jgi:hypothetical protein
MWKSSETFIILIKLLELFEEHRTGQAGLLSLSLGRVAAESITCITCISDQRVQILFFEHYWSIDDRVFEACHNKDPRCQRLEPFHIRSPVTISRMADLLVPWGPFIVASASTVPAFHIFREFANLILKPTSPRPSKTLPHLAQTTPSTPSATLSDDGTWFPTSLFGTVRAPAFTIEPTPLIAHTMLSPPAPPVKNLDHLPDVLSSDPARAMMAFVVIVTSFFFIQFFVRHIQPRRRFFPITHIVSTVIIVCIYTLVGAASHDALLNLPVTLQQAKESALPVACAALATFSIFNTLASVIESVFRNVLGGIEVSAVPDHVRSLPIFWEPRSCFT